jgi:NADPH2:quinone reductase
MKSCWIVTKDHKATLEWRDVPVPQPGAGEVVIKVHATALNRGEIVVGGVVHGGPEKLGGNEAAGVVTAVGAGVTQCKVGDRVFGRVRGGFAEYAAAPAHQMMPLPACLTFEQAASIPVVYLTAYEMIYPPYGKLKPGNWLLITGASSGVGAACIQIAKALGAKTIGTSGSAAKLEKLRASGLDFAIHTRKPDFATQVKEITGGKGVDLAINLVGGTLFGECIKCLARKGRLAVVGYVDGVLKAEIDLSAVHGSRFEIFGISNSKVTQDERRQSVADFTRDVLPAINDGRIVPLVDRVFDFSDIQSAKDCMESSALTGKVVVRVAAA